MAASVWWYISCSPLLWATLLPQEFPSGLGLSGMSWAMKCPLTTPGTLVWQRWEAALNVPGVAWPKWEAKVGIINHPDSLRTFLPLIVARVEQYHCYWSFKQFLLTQVVARMETYWRLKPLILRPCTQWSQVRPFVLSWTTLACDLHLSPHGRPLRGRELSSVR